MRRLLLASPPRTLSSCTRTTYATRSTMRSSRANSKPPTKQSLRAPPTTRSHGSMLRKRARRSTRRSTRSSRRPPTPSCISCTAPLAVLPVGCHGTVVRSPLAPAHVCYSDRACAQALFCDAQHPSPLVPELLALPRERALRPVSLRRQDRREQQCAAGSSQCSLNTQGITAGEDAPVGRLHQPLGERVVPGA